MRKLSIFLFVFFVSVTLASLRAQESVKDTTLILSVLTLDGNEYVGELVERNAEVVILNTYRLGVVTIKTSDIKRTRIVKPSEIKSGQVWTENAQASRYFYTPNGYGLRKGEGYYQNVLILFNQLSYGVSNRFTVGMGTVPVFLFGADAFPIWVTAKWSIPVIEDKVNLGIGGLGGFILNGGESFGIPFGTATFGNRDANFNFGLGWAYGGGEFANRPTITLSYINRYSKRSYFITDNYLITSPDFSSLFLSAGGRTLWGNFALDYGGVLPIGGDIGTFIVIPWLGISINFGQ